MMLFFLKETHDKKSPESKYLFLKPYKTSSPKSPFLSPTSLASTSLVSSNFVSSTNMLTDFSQNTSCCVISSISSSFISSYPLATPIIDHTPSQPIMHPLTTSNMKLVQKNSFHNPTNNIVFDVSASNIQFSTKTLPLKKTTKNSQNLSTSAFFNLKKQEQCLTAKLISSSQTHIASEAPNNRYLPPPPPPPRGNHWIHQETQLQQDKQLKDPKNSTVLRAENIQHKVTFQNVSHVFSDKTTENKKILSPNQQHQNQKFKNQEKQTKNQHSSNLQAAHAHFSMSKPRQNIPYSMNAFERECPQNFSHNKQNSQQNNKIHSSKLQKMQQKVHYYPITTIIPIATSSEEEKLQPWRIQNCNLQQETKQSKISPLSPPQTTNADLKSQSRIHNCRAFFEVG